jgi:predicted RNase H-like HicB family nuclease
MPIDDSNPRAIIDDVPEHLHLTIVYETDPDSGWIMASIPEVPGANSQGRTKEEAREMVLDALAGLSELRSSEREPLGESLASESLDIVSA